MEKNEKELEMEKVIQKNYPSAFLKTDLEEYLRTRKIEKLVVVGMMSQILTILEKNWMQRSCIMYLWHP